MAEVIQVMVVDDHQMVREGIISLLREYPGFVVCGEASQGKEALRLVAEADPKPDVILMDINMPVMDGIACATEIRRRYEGAIKVLALTMINQASYIRKMLKAGASGYILKDCDKYELFRAIITLHQGGTHFSQGVSQAVMEDLAGTRRPPATPVPVLLTKREKEVLALVVQDLSNQEIADRLFISVRTVESHKQNLLSKTGTQSVAGLVVYAIRHQLVDLA